MDDGVLSMSRDRWDPQYVADQVGPEPAALVAWMRDNMIWSPYAGALRGPEGALMDRRVNSLDGALLLARLLELAGHEARIGAADLDAAGVAALLEPSAQTEGPDRGRHRGRSSRLWPKRPNSMRSPRRPSPGVWTPAPRRPPRPAWPSSRPWAPRPRPCWNGCPVPGPPRITRRASAPGWPATIGPSTAGGATGSMPTGWRPAARPRPRPPSPLPRARSPRSCCTACASVWSSSR